MAQIELSICYTRTVELTREVTVDIPDHFLVEDENDRYDNIHGWLTDNQEKWVEDSEAVELNNEIEIDEFTEPGE